MNSSVPGQGDSWNGTPRLWRNGTPHSDFRRPFCWQYITTAFLSVPSSFAPSAHLTSLLNSHRPESHATELTAHRARVRHTAAHSWSKPIPEGDLPESLYHLVTRIKHAKPCTISPFAMMLFYSLGSMLDQATLQTRAPPDPQKLWSAQQLHIIHRYILWLVFLTFHNMSLLVCIWIIINF